MTGRYSASAVGNDAPVWDEEAKQAGMVRYLDGVMNVTPYAAAARCTDYTENCARSLRRSIEPFRDETKIYVESLRRANVRSNSRYSTALFTVLT